MSLFNVADETGTSMALCYEALTHPFQDIEPTALLKALPLAKRFLDEARAERGEFKEEWDDDDELAGALHKALSSKDCDVPDWFESNHEALWKHAEMIVGRAETPVPSASDMLPTIQAAIEAKAEIPLHRFLPDERPMFDEFDPSPVVLTHAELNAKGLLELAADKKLFVQLAKEPAWFSSPAPDHREFRVSFADILKTLGVQDVPTFIRPHDVEALPKFVHDIGQTLGHDEDDE